MKPHFCLSTFLMAAVIAFPLGAMADATYSGNSVKAGQVTVDFSAVEYYPNLKSKIGFSSNFVNVGLENTIPLLDELGPGLVCSNLEFDHWYKWKSRPVPALVEKYQVQGDPTSQPVETLDHPSPWLVNYVQSIGDLNIAQMIQITGAPPQFHPGVAIFPAIHPAPTNLKQAANFIGNWLAKGNLPYPILWSLWNEPGHEMGDVAKGKNISGQMVSQGESDADFAKRRSTQRATAVEQYTNLYALVDQEIRVKADGFSRLGFGSLISADFDPDFPMPDGGVFFDALFKAFTTNFPNAEYDYLTFNNFYGKLDVILSGTRASLANAPAGQPIILTQYAPGVMITAPAKRVGNMRVPAGVTPMMASIAMLDDLVRMSRATDLQAACMAYWLDGKFGFLVNHKKGISKAVRYFALQMYMDLPVWRTSLDLGSSSLADQGLRGLAGVNGSRAAILFWNESANDLTVPVTVLDLPAGVSKNQAEVSILADGLDAPQVQAFNGQSVSVPAQGIAFISFNSANAPDPLARRKNLSPAKFLATSPFPARAAAPCTKTQGLNDAAGCGSVSATYGFYDSVRSSGFLGKGADASEPHFTASYQALPDKVALTFRVIGTGTVSATATYLDCGQSVQAALSKGTGTLVSDAVPAACRQGPVTLDIALSGATTGSQAVVYLDSDAQVAKSLDQSEPALHPAPDLSVDEAQN